MNTLRASAELIRLPNTFTAAADALAGYWLATGTFQASPRLAWLILASTSLYSAGIIFNDLKDVAIDRVERPGRPLPSGQISLNTARILAGVFSSLGIVAAWVAGGAVAQPLNSTLLVALGLLLAILLYNYALKNTLLGPLTMGICRGLNLLMPMAVVGLEATEIGGLATAIMVLYIASVTWFGRDEAGSPGRSRLLAGGLGIMAALIVLGAFPAWNRSQDPMTLILWLALLVHLSRILLRAVRFPAPHVVRYAMKTFILGIIALDATFATAAVGWYGGAVILLLLVPAVGLGRWLYST